MESHQGYPGKRISVPSVSEIGFGWLFHNLAVLTEFLDLVVSRGDCRLSRVRENHHLVSLCTAEFRVHSKESSIGSLETSMYDSRRLRYKFGYLTLIRFSRRGLKDPIDASKFDGRHPGVRGTMRQRSPPQPGVTSSGDRPE